MKKDQKSLLTAQAKVFRKRIDQRFADAHGLEKQDDSPHR